jgi:hypothetical protein
MRKLEHVSIGNEELLNLLEQHRKSKLHIANCKRLNLEYADFSSIDFSNDGKGFDFSNAILFNVNFSAANLENCNFTGATMRGADFAFANLTNAVFQDACLIDSDFTCSDLTNANFKWASIFNSDFNEAEFTNTIFSMSDYGSIRCPEEGSFIAFKKLRGGLICKLRIPEDALRSSATTNKCRASKAEVISIKNGDEMVERGFSLFEDSFVYRVGDVVEADDFDENRWRECASGIHFFLTEQQAKDY